MEKLPKVVVKEEAKISNQNFLAAMTTIEKQKFKS